MKIIVNAITILRIIGSVILLFMKPLSINFYVIYTLCGLSDILDGYLARKFNVTSKFGATLDSIADFVFTIIMFIILIPIISWENKIIFSVVIVFIIRILSLCIGFAKYHELAFLHTYANKITGLLLFLFPFLYKILNFRTTTFIFCSMALLSAVEELIINIKSKDLDKNIKTILKLKL